MGWTGAGVQSHGAGTATTAGRDRTTSHHPATPWSPPLPAVHRHRRSLRCSPPPAATWEPLPEATKCPKHRQARVCLRSSRIPSQSCLAPPRCTATGGLPGAPLSGDCSRTEVPREQAPDCALTLEKKAPKPWERGTKPPRDALGHTRAYRLYRLGLASRCPAPGARAELRGICPQEGPPPPVTAGWHPHLRRRTPSCRSAQGSQALCRQQGDPRRGRPDHATRPAPALCLAAILCHNFFSLSLRTLLLGQLRR